MVFTMCGRFTLISPLDVILHRFKLVNNGIDYVPRYNIAPSQQVLAIISDGEERRIGRLRWGLVPYWAKDVKLGYKMINARAETLAEKPSFKRSFQRRRCIIPADGFYEWRQGPDSKQPVRIRLKSKEPFAFAGLWDRWQSEDGDVVTSCTIVTTKANELLRDIHHRMPVILRPQDEAVWLDRTINDTDFLQQLLVPYPTEQMEVYNVSDVVNSAKNEGPECIEPV